MDQPKPLHAPMSERQQLALLKKLEKSSGDASNGCSNPDATSPQRPPLQVVNGPKAFRVSTEPEGIGSSNIQSPRTPAEDRIMKRILHKDNKGESYLHKASIRGSTQLVLKLLKLKSNPNVTDFAGYTPLHEACNKGHVQVVKLLIEYGAKVNTFGGEGELRETPLHDAAKNGHLKVVKVLLQHGADLTARKENGHTPLDEVKHILANLKEGNSKLEAIAQFLTEHQENGGANLSISDSEDSDSDSECNNKDIAKFLGLSNSPSVEKVLEDFGVESPKIINVTDSSTKKTKKRLSIRKVKRRGRARQSLDMEDKGETPTVATPAEPEGANTNPAKKSETEKEDVAEKVSKSNTPEPEKSVADAAEKDKTLASAEKRPGSEEPSEEEETKKKRRKDESGKEAKPGRTTRGSSLEKSSSKGSGKGKSGSVDRKSPSSLSNSAMNSPKANSDSDDENSKKSTDSSGLKVPPLKIVLSGNGGTGQDGEGTKRSNSKDEIMDTQESLNKIVKNDSEDSNQADGSKGDGDSGDGKSGSGASRMTRSRANQSTPSGDQSTSEGNAPTETNSSQNQDPVPEKTEKNYTEYHVKKRKLRSQVEDEKPSTSTQSSGNGRGSVSSTSAAAAGNSNGNGAGPSSSVNSNEPLNDIQKYLNIRKQVEQRRKNLFPVYPKPPSGFRDYLMNRKTYLLQSNANERLRSMPMLQPPPSLEGPMRDLFIEQEKERYSLRKRHLVEKEKLVLTVEQEILRVHGRAARALANQPFPYSVCTILRDEEIYTPIDSQQEEKNRDIRSRYNGRLFLSWLQDVDDKWEKIKEQMVLRQHNEAEALSAVQKMDWELKLNELNSINAPDGLGQKVDDLYVPMVQVSDDFDLSDTR